jgi:hypothetical protein
MTLQNQFERELSKLVTGSIATLSVDVAPRRLTCDVVARNALAVSFNQVRLTTAELSGSDTTRLEQLGRELSERLTYLMEPISPIEIDQAACVVQLRSNPPQRDDDGRSYYELVVRSGGEIALVRYRKENGNARRQITATLTREALARLVGDFCATLDNAS